jgi:hypothetical protein
MGWLRSVAREVYGLFVDDGSFALALLVWIIAAAVGLPLLGAGNWGGVALFAGLAVVLAESALRAARRR